MKEILEIKELSYGEFPQICALNPRFRPGSKKVKIVLDVHVAEVKKGEMDLSSVFRELAVLLPSLERHRCGEQLLESLKSRKRPLQSSRLDNTTSVAHMMEHVIIDLQSNITGMDSCSGITCGYKNPSFRFDLFVECKDRKVGAFSAFFAADLVRRLMSGKSLSRRYRALIDLAKYLFKNKSHRRQLKLDTLSSQISSEFGWKEGFVVPLLRKLNEFGLLSLRDSLAT
ncbi:MAG: hypothetical protein GTO24_14475 [candidate division Zixibacteria bacterium]|nr:hypothetical protein [candidate division Zixibacteria bacterium]